MDNWAGIKPKSSNQNKTSGVKPNQKNKMLKQHHHQTNVQKSLEEEVARVVQDVQQTSSQKSREEQVAIAVQSILALNKTNQSNGSDNTTILYNENVSKKTLSPTQDSSGISIQDDSNLKTPENESSFTVDVVGRGKKNKKYNQLKRPLKLNNFDVLSHENFDGVEEDDGSQSITPKRPKYYQGEIDESILQEKCAMTNNISKYLKVEGGEGRIISAYYTTGQDEKLKDFLPMYVNIGNRFQAKELIGIRPNTKFISTNTKSKARSKEEQANYLVLSFENRKKNNSPFIEYPLSRLDMIIHALQELKENAIKSGHYNEPPVLNCKYPQNTKNFPKDDKDTILNLM